MAIQHHPGDDLLLALAAGSLAAGPRLVVAAHVEACPRCRARVRVLEAAGGVLLEDLPDADLAPQALARTHAAIDAASGLAAAQPHPALAPRLLPRHPPLPGGMAWPRALAGCHATPWRWIGPGMRRSRVRVPADSRAQVFLLHIAAGKCLPKHTHSHEEWTQVLHGRFDDGRALFGPGDFDAADSRVRHQPVVQAGSDCVCLAAVQGRVVFDGLVARTLGSLLGM